MRTFTSLSSLSPAEFKRLTGVSRPIFDRMVEVVTPTVLARQHKGGPRFKWGVEDMILMTLAYWREYRTYFHIALDYDISESQCFRTVKFIEDTLTKDNRFHIQGKRALLEKKEEGRYIIIDVAESPIERPQKKGVKNKQKHHYSGKKKRHTLKTQYIISDELEIIATSFAPGRRHDFGLYKQSDTHLAKDMLMRADSGSQDLQKLHTNTVLPKKATKKRPLSKENKKHNHDHSSLRISVEHTIRRMKVFRITKETDRNRRKRFGLRVNLIVAKVNMEWKQRNVCE